MTPAVAVLPKHTLNKVLYFILAKLKDYTLFILYFSQIFKKCFIIGLNCLKGSEVLYLYFFP